MCKEQQEALGMETQDTGRLLFHSDTGKASQRTDDTNKNSSGIYEVFKKLCYQETD